MDKEAVNKIIAQIDKVLKARGVDPTVSDFNNKISRTQEIKRKVILDHKIAKAKAIQEKREKEEQEYKAKVLKAIEDIEVNPQVNVDVPKVIVPKIEIPEIKIPEIKLPDIPIPEIKIPTINVPKPQVNVNVPEIKVPEVIMPKEMEVKGLGSFIMAILEIFKNQLNVKLGGINRDKPLPVILVDEDGRYYKAIAKAIAGGGGNIKGLMNVAGTIINPSTEEKQDDTITELGEIKTAIGNIDSDDQFQGYGLFAVLTEAGTNYILKENKTGEWIMKRLVASTGTTTYSTGTSDASTA